MGAGQDLQAQADVADPPRHRPLHGHGLEGQGPVGAGNRLGVRDKARRGPDGGDGAGVGGIAQGTADVVAEAQGAHARGQGRALPAAGAAGREALAPGVPRQAVEGGVGVDAQAHVRQVGAADGNGAGGAHALDHGGVHRRRDPGECGQAVGGRQARHVDVFLDRDGHAVEPAQGRSGLHLAVRLGGPGPGLVRQHPHDGVQPGIDLGDPPQVGLDDLSRGDLSAGDHPRQFTRRPAPEFRHLSLPSPFGREPSRARRALRAPEAPLLWPCPGGVMLRCRKGRNRRPPPEE